jgi:uncharacterized protein YuzE
MATLGLTIEAGRDGNIEAAYLRVSSLPVSRTREIVPNVLLADYSKSGTLVGIEILGPVKSAAIVRLVKNEKRRTTVREFVRKAAPKSLVTT